jgi:hypothetical protein
MHIKYLNHASVLINNDGNFLLLDPWYIKPSFGSWLPSPPSAINPAYIVALAKSRKGKFAIVVSHGHDDHCDDEYLQLFPKETKIIIPKYKSSGFRNRIRKNGFENINEVGLIQQKINNFYFRSYIHSDISHDDAIVTIRTENELVVHANDNWKHFSKECSDTIKQDIKNISDKNKVLLMSQCNIADCFPLCYTNISEQEKNNIANDRAKTMIKTALSNARQINAKYFLNYAGHAQIFIKDNPKLNENFGFKSFKFIKNCLSDKTKENVEVLEMYPGDSFNFEEVIKLFDGDFYSDKELKQASIDFYKHYETAKKGDSYVNNKEILSHEEREHFIKRFVENFNIFVCSKKGTPKEKYKDRIFNSTVGFQALNKKTVTALKIGESVICDFKENTDTTFKIKPSIFDAILLGKINWENAYVGCQIEVFVKDKDYNNCDIVRWLAMYGYVYKNKIIKEIVNERNSSNWNTLR